MMDSETESRSGSYDMPNCQWITLRYFLSLHWSVTVTRLSRLPVSHSGLIFLIDLQVTRRLWRLPKFRVCHRWRAIALGYPVIWSRVPDWLIMSMETPTLLTSSVCMFVKCIFRIGRGKSTMVIYVFDNAIISGSFPASTSWTVPIRDWLKVGGESSTAE